jgi:hypothetical protein
MTTTIFLTIKRNILKEAKRQTKIKLSDSVNGNIIIVYDP